MKLFYPVEEIDHALVNVQGNVTLKENVHNNMEMNVEDENPVINFVFDDNLVLVNDTEKHPMMVKTQDIQENANKNIRAVDIDHVPEMQSNKKPAKIIRLENEDNRNMIPNTIPSTGKSSATNKTKQKSIDENANTLNQGILFVPSVKVIHPPTTHFHCSCCPCPCPCCTRNPLMYLVLPPSPSYSPPSYHPYLDNKSILSLQILSLDRVCFLQN